MPVHAMGWGDIVERDVILTTAHSILQTCVLSSFLTAPSGPCTQLQFLQGLPSGESQLSPS